MDEGESHQLLPQSIQEDINLLLQYKRTCEKRWKLEKKLKYNMGEYEDRMCELTEEEKDLNIELGDAEEQCEMVKNRIPPSLSDVIIRIDSNFVVGDDDFFLSGYVLC
jgi:hypothetical protein